MAENWIVNASPLIALAKAGYERLLTAAGLYLDDAVIRSVLQQVGETWPPAAPPDSPRPGYANPA